MSSVLSNKDVNAPVQVQDANNNTKVAGAKALEYQRQLLQSKMEEEKNKQHYISPSDNIMSPCTAKLTALKGRQASRAKPKSLFAQSSAKKFDSENIFGGKTAPHPNPNPNPFGGDHDGNGNIQPRGI